LRSTDDEGFCGRCWLTIPRIQGLICAYCGLPLKEGGQQCFDCRTTPSGVLIRAAAIYGGPLRPAIHRFKYLGRVSLSKPLGNLMCSAWDKRAELRDIQALVPVPGHPANERRRGYNQATLLAKAIEKQLNKPVLEGLLIASPARPPQSSLNKEERKKAVKNAFAVNHADRLKRLIKGKSFLLVDDVATTTSTLNACGRALRLAGAKSVKALVLARDL